MGKYNSKIIHSETWNNHWYKFNESHKLIIERFLTNDDYFILTINNKEMLISKEEMLDAIEWATYPAD